MLLGRRTKRSRWRRHRALRRTAIVGLVLIGSAALWDELGSSAPAEALGPPVAVVRHDLPAGSVLDENAVTAVDLPPDSPLHAVALSPAAALGRTTADALRSGEMVTAARLVDPGGAPSGFTVMPVTFPDADVVRYLAAGTVLDILWTPDDFDDRESQVVATGAVVVQQGPPASDGDTAPWDSGPVLLQVREADTGGLAAAMGTGRLSVLLRGP